MSVKTKTTAQTRLPPFAFQQIEDTPRCAILENGKIIHANDAFEDLIGQPVTSYTDFFDIFELESRKKSLAELLPGNHSVRSLVDAVSHTMHFDWLNLPDNTRYLIASVPTADLDDTNTDLSGELYPFRSPDAATITSEIGTFDDRDFLAFVQMTHDVMVITDTAGHILKANQTFIRNFLKDSKELDTTNLVDFFSQEERRQVRNTMQTLVREARDNPEHTVNFESRIISLKGESRWVEWRQKYMDGHIYFSGRDITDIRRKHDDLLRRQKQLSEAEAIGRMGHWHWLIGEDNISWSEEIFRIFGVDQNRFVPTINRLNDFIHKRDLGRVVQVFQRAIIEEQNYDMEFRIVRPGGDIRFIHCEGRCEKDDNGEVIALYGIMQDMTERMLYEQELKEAKDASEQAYAAKSRFLANMSHELRTPLNAIIGFAEMMCGQMLGPIFNEKYLEYARNIKESGEHLLDLISDILDMSKIEAGKYTLDLEEISVNAIIRRAVNMIEGRAMEEGIRLRTNEIDNDDVLLVADRRAITQVFINLLSNAVKFTKKGGQVWIECEKSTDYVTFRVCDNGIGIPPNKLASVLKPFEQVSSQYTRDHEGTGLGLSITKELIELHGGSISIESALDIGTTVSVRLPYVAHERHVH